MVWCVILYTVPSSVADREQKYVDHKHDQGLHCLHVFLPPVKCLQDHLARRAGAPASLGSCLPLSDRQGSLSDWVWNGLTSSVSGWARVHWVLWLPVKARGSFIAVQNAWLLRVGQHLPVSQAIDHPIGSLTCSSSWLASLINEDSVASTHLCQTLGDVCVLCSAVRLAVSKVDLLPAQIVLSGWAPGGNPLCLSILADHPLELDALISAQAGSQG